MKNSNHIVKLGIIFLVLAILTIWGIFYFKENYLSKPVYQTQNSTENKTISYQQIENVIEAELLKLKTYENQNISKNNFLLQDADYNEGVIVHFWASWCDPCINEIPDLIEYAKKNTKTKIILVSQDFDFDSLNKFLKSFPELKSKRFLQIWDAENLIVRELQFEKLPVTLFVASDKSTKVQYGVVPWKNL